MEKHELKDIQLFEENGQYYLKLKYIIENDHRVEELEIPKVCLRFNKNFYPNLNYRRDAYKYQEECDLCTGFGSMKVLPGETSEANHVFYTVKLIEEKPVEMSVSEIEKKLGYKIKIVNKD